MLYNLDKLTELSGGDEEFIASVVSVFLDETPNDLQSLKEAVANSDFEGIYQHAHKIKPNVDLLGMEDTRVKVLAIETQGRGDKDMAIIKTLFPDVEVTINEAMHELKAKFNL